MTTTSLATEDAARQACAKLDLPARGLTPVRAHATSVYALPAAQAIIRVSRADQHEHISRAVTLTRWLDEHDVPVTQPLDVPQPVTVHGFTVSFWHHYPQPVGAPAPHPEHLARILRRVHALPPPPCTLPVYEPLSSLRTTVRASTSLSPDDRSWLLDRAEELLATYADLNFPLGHGLIHGDAYPGNTLWDDKDSLARLGDWDEAAYGPRELDLANTFQGVRFGRTAAQLRAFSAAYGYGLAQWPGTATLVAIRDLHTLGSFVRRADRGDAEASAQLAYRLRTLRTEDAAASWDSH
ncbi:phosphotransferase family protein [Streptomyces kanamyceticus]|uniref:Aminoglycoside phosphotransferase family protein n=1 Tax=Streptomyces kanamyceticus TaxID=1967 RepID=A0A5J6GNC8_STRKN|nr:aminoglycoside phosphotransferase family protein [Streptomyces kanamyceticus]QEU95902.1 aminoglycoside phosphotransferase family protein [Streptomyces kanamyceticus]